RDQLELVPVAEHEEPAEPLPQLSAHEGEEQGDEGTSVLGEAVALAPEGVPAAAPPIVADVLPLSDAVVEAHGSSSELAAPDVIELLPLEAPSESVAKPKPAVPLME